MLKHYLAVLTLVFASAMVTAGSAFAAGYDGTLSESRPYPTPATVAMASDFVADVVGPYLAIQTALVNDDLVPVGAAAKALQNGASTLGADGQALTAAAARAAAATTLEAARVALGDLSAALIAYADKTKQPVAGKIVAFCPMVNKSWVQADGAIANPYYGKAMSSCGSRTRTLSAAQ